MHLDEMKARTADLLGRITLRLNEDGDEYHHLEAAEWVELDEIKHALARAGGVSAFGSYAGSNQRDIDYTFDLGEGLAIAVLRYRWDNDTISLSIALVDDPSKVGVEDYEGDANQAWTLFRLLPADERHAFKKTVLHRNARMPPNAAMLLGGVEPPIGIGPLERHGAQLKQIELERPQTMPGL